MDTDEFTMLIDSLSYGGRGVGRRGDGKVVFVPMALPGDQVRVSIEREYSSYCIGRVTEILRSSPHRVEPGCPYFTECGGCDWQHLSYSEQLRWKETILRQELSKIAHIDLPGSIEVTPSKMEYGYRGHATLQCSNDPEPALGFFRKGSKSVVGIECCAVLRPRVQEIASQAREILRKNPIYGLKTIEIHCPQDEGIVQARCRGHIHKNALNAVETLYRDLDISGLSFVVHSSRRSDHVLGQRFCRYSLPLDGREIQLACSFGDFIQANMQVNAILVGSVLDLARGSRKILDLYSGSGNFSIPLSFAAPEVVAIERSPRLASLGKTVAKKNLARNVRFLAMDALKAVTSIRDESLEFDTVVMDPPREGAKEVAQLIPELGASRVVYISCNPSTLARDLAVMCGAGFFLKSIRLFDMFPQTYHIESVAYLER
ncbi:MAG: class I SAM-dependent RNA methyltransferase [Desulfomonilia bacterium]|jgi:23S rRNA (uracil1939-C5)-methyltransferase